LTASWPCIRVLPRGGEAGSPWSATFRSSTRSWRLAALAVLPGDSGRAGAEVLIDLADRYGFRRVDQLLSEWIERRGLAT